MPVGTAATVKAMKPADVRATGADIILGNTYHLMLRPGAERIARLGGLHAFMGWERPILTDSGGYQVMSLCELSKVSEEGVAFASHLDGSRHMLTPERSMEIQGLLGSDIVMAFDQLVKTTEPVEAQRGGDGALDALGGTLARELCGSGRAVRHPAGRAGRGAAPRVGRGARSAIGFDGYAVGGLAVGEGQAAMFACLDFAPQQLPADKPRYLMGVGKPDDIVGAVERGIDMFDCVLPTRSGRTGQAFTWDGPINIRNAKFADDPAPLDPESPTAGWSKAYLHHLVRSNEILGAMLMTEHNLWFYQRLMQGLRDAIAEQTAGGFRRLVQGALLPTRRQAGGMSRTILIAALALAGCVRPAPAEAASAPSRRSVRPTIPRSAYGGLNQDIRVGSLSRPAAGRDEDSRCPVNVACVWAGRLVLRARVSGMAGEQTISSIAPLALPGGGTLELASVWPPRMHGAQRAEPLPLRLPPSLEERRGRVVASITTCARRIAGQSAGRIDGRIAGIGVAAVLHETRCAPGAAAAGHRRRDVAPAAGAAVQDADRQLGDAHPSHAGGSCPARACR